MTELVCGTAHLWGLVDAQASARLLASAYEAGVRRFDTAPSYGAGRTEAELGAFVAAPGRAGRDELVVTSKVGIAPASGPTGLRRQVGRVVRALPAPLARRIRSAALGATTHGQFDVDSVRASVEQSLQRLGRLDRLMLHEVAPADVTAELVDLLEGYRTRGDVGEVGVATAGAVTADAVERAPGLLTAVHLDAGLLAAPVELPTTVRTRVAHGVFGPGGVDLALLRGALRDEAGLGARWRDATDGTPYAGPTGLPDALLAGVAGGGGWTDVIVATSRPANLERAVAVASAAQPLPAAAAAVLADAAARVRRPAVV